MHFGEEEHQRFGLFSSFENSGPFSAEERELGQDITPFLGPFTPGPRPVPSSFFLLCFGF